MKKENIWIIFAIIFTTVLSILSKSEFLQIIGALLGIIYVFGTAKENRYSQLFGIVNSAIYAYLMYKDRLYGTALYDMLYCIPIQIYTFYTWGKKGENKKEISKFPYKQRLLISLIIIICIISYSIIANLLNINYAIIDGVTIILGMYGLYLVSQKKIEQWYAFIISNIVTLVYWTIKCIESTSNIAMLLMWTIYLFNNCYGLFLWNKKIRNNNSLL